MNDSCPAAQAPGGVALGREPAAALCCHLQSHPPGRGSPAYQTHNSVIGVQTVPVCRMAGHVGTSGIPQMPVRLRRDSRAGRAVTWPSEGKRVAQRQSKEFGLPAQPRWVVFTGWADELEGDEIFGRYFEIESSAIQ
jgi:hypothetical protein